MAAPRPRGRARIAALVLAISACSDVGERTGRAALPDVASGWKIADSVDFNGDGLGDILWVDPTTNRVSVFLLRGTQLMEPGPVFPGPGVGWEPPTAEDFNFDGLADIPWFDARSRRAAVWLTRGTHLAEPGAPFPGPRGNDWTLAYTGDFNADGMGDLLWHDPVRSRFTIWLMQGTHVLQRGPELPAPPGEGWTAPITGDFNFDGISDIVWYNTHTDCVSIWLMRGTEVLEQGPQIHGPLGPFHPAPSTGDFNRDGISDLVWNDPPGNLMTIWLMRGTHIGERGPMIHGPPGDGWITAGVTDADGDGLADVIWQGANPVRFAVWLMEGTTVRLRGPEIPGPP